MRGSRTVPVVRNLNSDYQHARVLSGGAGKNITFFLSLSESRNCLYSLAHGLFYSI